MGAEAQNSQAPLWQTGGNAHPNGLGLPAFRLGAENSLSAAVVRVYMRVRSPQQDSILMINKVLP
jgi:hypothetical protein